MRATALISLIFLTITCSAQAGQPSYQKYPTTPPETYFQGKCDSDADGTKFAEKACYTTTYHPNESGYGARYRPPTCDKSKPLSPEQKATLAKAYSRAPDYMKAKLCRLTQLFVTRSRSSWGPMGWGFWVGPDRLASSKNIYVAISDQQLTSKKSFVDVENQTNGDLLRAESPDKGLLRIKTGVALEPELAVLAELSHELGHVLVADANMDGIKRYHPRRKVSGPPRNACFETAFIDASWDKKLFNKRLQRWVDFGEQYGNRAKNPELKFSLERLRRDARRGNFDTANRVIKAVYASKEFAGFNASIHPVEDAVVTYTYKVLYDVMGNQKARFDVDGRDIPVFDNLDSGVLQKKVQCLSDFGFFSGQP